MTNHTFEHQIDIGLEKVRPRQLWQGFARQFALSIAACFLLTGVRVSINAATLPPGFTETSVSGLTAPTAMELAPDGRLFVCLQGGQLRVIKNGALLATPFLTVTTDSSGERGLL